MRKNTMFNFSHTALWLGSLCSKGSERSSPNRAFSLSMETAIKKNNRTEERAFKSFTSADSARLIFGTPLWPPL